MAHQQEEGKAPAAGRDPDIVRLEREHARHRAEMKNMWQTIGSTREEVSAMRASLEGSRNELQDFRNEIRTGMSELSGEVKKLTQSVVHTEGSRSGAHSTVKIVLTTIGLTLTVAIVAIGVVEVVMA